MQRAACFTVAHVRLIHHRINHVCASSQQEQTFTAETEDWRDFKPELDETNYPLALMASFSMMMGRR